ncbi:hypothetical protein C8250_037795 [Streptomyces sp. So13.3]|uniref:hypothetical protein n=1 Tax=Streptomyces sp. So13.3 TaxID=2136173 RepID=UPI00164DE219|nr:hypothetical protein [Streptomyces sp. So13.3]QNA76859.1 hypothetical protein C8250_037795 [Streptomyces sp. So13.3]
MSDTPHAPAPGLSAPADIPTAVPEADEHRRVEELAAHAAKEGVRTGPFASPGRDRRARGRGGDPAAAGAPARCGIWRW